MCFFSGVLVLGFVVFDPSQQDGRGPDAVQHQGVLLRLALRRLQVSQCLSKPHSTYCVTSKVKWKYEIIAVTEVVHLHLQSGRVKFILNLLGGFTAILCFSLGPVSYCAVDIHSSIFLYLLCVCSTGSSLMPQKKNADSLELIRSKAGRVFGNVREKILFVKSSFFPAH